MAKTLFNKYKHGLLMLYVAIYFPWFLYIDRVIAFKPYHIMYTPLDDMIPFLEVFIVPYLLWFAYVAGTVIFFFFTDTKLFYKLMFYLMIGMTLFLIISSIFPNGQCLRPVTFTRDNIFIDLVKGLYKTDSSVNVFPSIHVYNSIATHIAITKSEKLQKYKLVQVLSFVLMTSIVLATMFIKQHSIIDVLGGILLSIGVYQIIYKNALESLFLKRKPKLEIE